mmetsp:Transcript_49536/g.73812  ORF Transcript_49536/g.73812 Transcript_49536/m.73812 type:complete len:283 (+) Transcript_49536:241-1089(+)
MKHVGLARGLDNTGAVAWLHSQKVNNGSNSFFHLFELKSKLFQNLVAVSNCLPRLSEIWRSDLRHEVGRGDFELFQRVLLLERVSLLFASCGVDLHDVESKFTSHCCRRQLGIGVALQDNKTVLGISISNPIGGDLSRDVEAFRITVVNQHRHVVQSLVIDRVLYRELKHNVVGENVFDALNNVLGFAFGQRHRSCRSERSTKRGQLGNSVHSTGRVDDLLLLWFGLSHAQRDSFGLHGRINSRCYSEFFRRIFNDRKCLNSDWSDAIHGCRSSYIRLQATL